MGSRPDSVDTESQQCWELVLHMGSLLKMLGKPLSPSSQVLGQNTALNHACFLEEQCLTRPRYLPKAEMFH